MLLSTSHSALSAPPRTPRWRRYDDVAGPSKQHACATVLPARGSFGSVAKGESRVDSDIDLLVDLEPGRTLFDVAALHDELVELLGYAVDVLTSGAVRGRLAHVADEAVPL